MTRDTGEGRPPSAPAPGEPRTAEAQISAIDVLICRALEESPMQRLETYSQVCSAQLTLNLMLLNRIRLAEAQLDHLGKVLLQYPIRGNIPKKGRTNDNGNV